MIRAAIPLLGLLLSVSSGAAQLAHHVSRRLGLAASAHPWTLVYRMRGGLGGVERRLELTDSGALSVGQPDDRSSYVTTHASAELMARIRRYLETASEAQPSSDAPIPDALYVSLLFGSVDGNRELELPADIQGLLTNTMDAVIREALVGRWRQSAWMLCHPAKALTAEDVDPPIESLIFETDGRFSVTWLGGGARAYGKPSDGVPHVAVPDYVGRFRIEPAYAFMLLTVESAIHPPRDFSGAGHFRIHGDTLVLEGLWLGTYQAKRKPDICELTFVRTA